MVETSRIAKKIELAANVAIIVVAVVLAIVLVRVYLITGSQPSTEATAGPLKPGTTVSLPGLNWQENQKTLFLVLSTNCKFCTESAAFYQRLWQERKSSDGIRLIAIFPQQDTQGEKYLTDLGVQVDQILLADPGKVGATGTPTLILTSNQGVVLNSWLGKLSSGKELEVINSFR